MKTDIAKAIEYTLSSPNVPDSNMEPANVVDMIDKLSLMIRDGSDRIADAIGDLANAIRGLHND